MSTDTESTILNLHDLAAQQVAVCGGKRANLAKLAGAGFAVLDARIVTLSAYCARGDH